MEMVIEMDNAVRFASQREMITTREVLLWEFDMLLFIY
jgi:hypothetical protein